MYKLRDYQQEAIDALFKYWSEGGKGNPILQLSTGAGKSVVIADLVRTVVTKFNARVLVLSHVKEIIEQNHEKLTSMMPELDAGLHSASLFKRDSDNAVIFGSVQTLCREKGLNAIGAFNMVIVDECHYINSDDDKSMYMKVFNHLLALKPNMTIIGLSATPFRQRSGYLTDGEKALFDKIVYETDVQDLIDRGYLSDLITQKCETQIDTTGVSMVGGDFNQGELEARALDDDLCVEIADDLIIKGEGREGWLIFCVSIAHCDLMADLIRNRGITTEIITGSTPPHERERILEAFKRKEIRCVVNCSVLTTGFDAPHIDLVGILRPTRSPVMYVQILGRGLRMAEGKENCLIADYGGCVAYHGALDVFKPSKKSTKMVECSDCECAAEFSDSHKFCPFCRLCKAEDCDFIFTPKDKTCPSCKARQDEKEKQERQSKLTGLSGQAEVLSRHARPRPVNGMAASLHISSKGNECVKVEYFDGYNLVHKDFISPESPFARAHKVAWFDMVKINQADHLPYTNAELISAVNHGAVKMPDAIVLVKDESGYKRIGQMFFNPQEIRTASNPFAFDDSDFDF